MYKEIYIISNLIYIYLIKYRKPLNSAPQILARPKIFCTLNSAPPKILENHYIFLNKNIILIDFFIKFHKLEYP